MSLIGPLDKRLQVRLCKACQRRKIRCSKQTPCAYCIRIGQPCQRASNSLPRLEDTSVVFLPPQGSLTPFERRKNVSYEKSVTEVSICHLDTWMDPSDKLLSHFFFTFLATNDFTGKSWKSLNNYLIDLLNGSSGLKNVAVALAALDRSRMPCSSKMPETEISLKQRALVSYSSSLHGLKSKITNASPTPDWESTVWITFFLGIFELMLEPLETKWEIHFQYGTSRLLQLLGPQWCLHGNGRESFLTFRIFEISRALIFNESTFLAEPPWLHLVHILRTDFGEMSHPKEALYDLMICCSSLRSRVMDYIKSSEESDDSVIISLAAQGTEIRRHLSEWLQLVQTQYSALHTSFNHLLQDTELLISLIYFHALSIYLSGIYDYHSEFVLSNAVLPLLSQSQVEHHLSSIIRITDFALRETKLAGLLFLFPLRVAASRSRTMYYRTELLKLIRMMRNKGFAILETFELEILCIWAERDAALVGLPFPLRGREMILDSIHNV